MLCAHELNSTLNFSEALMPSIQKILTTAVIVLVVMAVVNRVPAIKSVVG